jgi:hypothetical protein
MGEKEWGRNLSGLSVLNAILVAVCFLSPVTGSVQTRALLCRIEKMKELSL